jgi:O-antigen biosynthesis protein
MELTLKIEERLVPFHDDDLVGKRVLVLAPHPDDEAIGCGESIARHSVSGDLVRVVILNCGAKGDISDKFVRDADISMRQTEIRAAWTCLGVSDMAFWDFDDQELSNSAAAITDLAVLIDAYHPDLIYAPLPMEIHPDYRAPAIFVQAALRICLTNAKVFFYEATQPTQEDILADITCKEGKKIQTNCQYRNQLEESHSDDAALTLNRSRRLTMPEDVTCSEGFIRESPTFLSTGIRNMTKWSAEPVASFLAGYAIAVIVRTQGLRQAMLKETLTSISGQSLPCMAVVVVHAEADILKHVESVCRETPGLSFVLLHADQTEKKRGYPLNVGLQYAYTSDCSVEAIAFLDDDDILYADFSARMIRALRDTGADVICAASNRRVPGEAVEEGYRPVSFLNLFVQNFIPINSYIVRKVSLAKAPVFFDESFDVVEDWHFLLQLLQNGFRFEAIMDTLSEFRIISDGNKLVKDNPEIWELSHNRIHTYIQDSLFLMNGQMIQCLMMEERLKVENHHETVAAMQKRLDDLIHRNAEEMRQKDEHLNRYAEEMRQKDEHLNRCAKEMRQKDENFENISHQIEDFKNESMRLLSQCEKQEKDLAMKAELEIALKAQIHQMDMHQQDDAQKIIIIEQSIAEKERFLQEIFASKGWRLLTIYRIVTHNLVSRPLRWIIKFFVSGILFIRQLCIGGLRWLFHSLPLTESASYRMKSFAYRRFGFLFQSTISYRVWQNARCDVCQLSTLMKPLMNLSNDIQAVDPDEVVCFSQSSNPEVSVVIPLIHRKDILFPCLKSLSSICSGHEYEILLMDSLPETESQVLLARIQGVRIIPAEQDKSMIDMWNLGASMARGKFIAFLDSYLLPLPGWIDEMVRVFSEQSEAGLVGSQIILSDGIIWEAGFGMGEEGSLCRLGGGADSFQPDFSYLREVDFCSAISFMIPKDFLIQIGGIPDGARENLVQAGAHLSVAARQAGRKVFNNPLSKAVIYSGPDENPWMNVDENCRAVRDGFLQKNILSSSSRCEKFVSSGKILVIDNRTPTPDQDSGSQDVVSFFNIFRSLGFDVTFIPSADLQFMDKYTPDLQRMGVRCLYSPFVQGIAEHLASEGKEYDLVLLYRAYCAEGCLDMVQRYCTRAKIIFDTVDLHFVRAQRQAVIENSQELLENAEKTKLLELSVIRKADCTIVLSTEEQEILIKEPSVYGKKIAVIPLIREIPGRKKPFSARKNILFVGGFEHSPNVDAMLSFVGDVWPLVKINLPKIVFYIIGSKPPKEILDLAEEDIIVTGYLSDISSYFHDCLLSVAPLRYGAGLKGKVATSLSYGLPCVASSVAVEGSGLEQGKNILVADKPEEIASAITCLYRDEGLWNKLSDRGLDFMTQHFSFAAGQRNLENLLRELGVLKG